MQETAGHAFLLGAGRVVAFFAVWFVAWLLARLIGLLIHKYQRRGGREYRPGRLYQALFRQR